MEQRPATIIRSAWRGEARNTSAPKRAMSKRSALADIISMAQQARPNVAGQSDELRPQLINLLTWVVRMPVLAPRGFSVPCERPLSPYINVAYHQDRQENEQFNQPQYLELILQ